ncbi:bifunctional lysine-specific demethylase and histidyl-hydroxylase NO66-like [Anastrepha obliqua]|uniref:bifunctional lysine-specific demethylase and histidyl-hydroxylase NO66-like n=1 Tax=Anastrepha obliqua TaxID=95512 RepID=UPI002409DF20|nr:bifunctional lysine-specific demethylase and histidyl-hydroxylase NO66-like [Anastrepha obliqua]
MSEPNSAYQGFASKRGNKTKNTNKKADSSKASVSKNSGVKYKTLEKNKPKVSPKNQVNSRSSKATKEKGAPVKSKGATKNAATEVETTKAKGAHKKVANKPETAKKQQRGHRAVTNGNTKFNGIKENEIDALVEQLLGDSSSHPKKLSKAQQKKKQELEDYLVRQLEKDDEERDNENISEEDESESDMEEYCSTCEDNSDEYTINSYTEEEGEEEESSVNDEYSSESDEHNKPVATSTKNTAALKRDTSAKAGNDANAQKKGRKSEKSVDNLPAATVVGTDKIVKPTEKRRQSVDLAGVVSTSTPEITVKTVNASAVKIEPLSPPNNIVKMNSIKEGEKLFNWLLTPLPIKEFFSKYWESGPCLIQRKGCNYYSHLISFQAIDQMLLKNHVEFTKNIDITSYENGERKMLNPVGRALPPVVWDLYGQGCSVRLPNPHIFLRELYRLNTTLQEYFHCLVGANAYLTPPNSQGFAPHYDDIEAFVLQIEGRKRWRLYKPRTQAEQLARFSSKNFTQQEIGQPIFEEVLEPGDMLYFPRGTIHQACTEPGYHSLHITLSMYQKQSYADLFEYMMPLVLQRAIETNIEMRCGLPLHIFQHAGVAFSDINTMERAELLRKVTKLMGQSLHSVPLDEIMDAAVDQLAKKYQSEALPPHLSPAEHERTIFGSHSMTNERGECLCDYEITERTNVRLLRANIMRLVQEDSKVRIYYYLDNSKEYCEYNRNFMEIEMEEAASVELLIRSYPEYIAVSQLPLEDEEHKVQMVTALWERGLLMTEKPFK